MCLALGGSRRVPTPCRALSRVGGGWGARGAKGMGTIREAYYRQGRQGQPLSRRVLSPRTSSHGVSTLRDHGPGPGVVRGITKGWMTVLTRASRCRLQGPYGWGFVGGVGVLQSGRDRHPGLWPSDWRAGQTEWSCSVLRCPVNLTEHRCPAQRE